MGLRAARIGPGRVGVSAGQHAAGCGCGSCRPAATPTPLATPTAVAPAASGVAQLCEHGHPWHSHLPVCPDPPFSLFSHDLFPMAPRAPASAGGAGSVSGGSSVSAPAQIASAPSVALPIVASSPSAQVSGGGGSAPPVAPVSVGSSVLTAPASVHASPASVLASAVGGSPAGSSGGAGAPVRAPAPPAGVRPRTWRQTVARGVQLGAAHQAGSRVPGKTISTPKTGERLARHMNAFLEGQPSKATPTGPDGQGNIAWEVRRAKAAKQASRGSRTVLQHMGGGGDDDPLDFFEDRGAARGNMSDTDSDSEPDADD